MRWAAFVLVVLIFIAGGIFLARHENSTVVIVAPTTAPATAPASQPLVVQPPPRPKDYMDVVRLDYPEFPTTQPLTVPVALSESAMLVIPDPLYLDTAGELWITRADAETTSNVFKTVLNQSTHVTRENVVYVQRWPDQRGVWQPQLICRKADGTCEIVTRSARLDIAGSRAYDWARAFSWNDVIVVPSDGGISIIRPDRRPMEIYHQFVPPDQFDRSKYSQVQATLDWRGLVAWMPTEEGKLGSKGAARFMDDKWTTLDAGAGWPERILQLVPLLDGSILQLVVDEQNHVDLAMTVLDPANVDPKTISDLVEQLADLDAEKREHAFGELTRYGQGIWPMLEKLQADPANQQLPETRQRLDQLLAAKNQPMLGGMGFSRGPVKVLARTDYGGVVVSSDSGVIVHRAGAENPTPIAPAVISILPGRVIELARDSFVEELRVKGRSLRVVRGELILIDNAEGPMWWLSNHLSTPLLRGQHLEFSELLGQDVRGRWLFRRNSTDTSPTLILDPTLPDPTPRLPIWIYPVEGGEVGWTGENWPVIKNGGAWALANSQWRPVDEAKEKYVKAADAPPAAPPLPPPPPVTQPTTMATTGPTSTPSLGPPLLAEADGTRFYDGKQSLRMITPDGKDITWELPPQATASVDPILLRAGENRLFLYNSPGRLLRLRVTPGKPEPFMLEAVFTKRVPNVDAPSRLWVDPAGRIIFAYDNNVLAICFPDGRVPPDIVKILPARELKEIQP